MPSWALILLQMLPTIIQEITVIVQAIQAGGGTPTPAQSTQLKALYAIHDQMMGAIQGATNV